MIGPEIATAVRVLRAQGESLHEIARALKLSRNTVKRVLRTEPPETAEAAVSSVSTKGVMARKPSSELSAELLRALFARAKGNVVRVQQLLESEYSECVPYSTLTRWARAANLREKPRARSGEYTFAPGEEMQHDTSPHRFEIGGRQILAHCASLVLAYSRRLYIQYYPRFTRLEAKHFLLQAVEFMEGAADRCVIDNSSVILAGGSGADAIVAPEMKAFARTLGFAFLAHELNDPDRKGRVERPFFWIETNFLPGRTFEDFDDVNRQALEWCRTIANVKGKKALGRTSPEAAYLLEKPHLNTLPIALPPVYEVIERCVDLEGFISVDTNRYSVPERLLGQSVSIYQYPHELQIYHRRALIATHPRLLGRRDARQTLPGHHSPLQRAPRRAPPAEPRLTGIDPLLDRYVSELLKAGAAVRPSQPRRALKRLLELKRTYPHSAFLEAIKQALRFKLFDLARLEAMILKHVSGEFFAMNAEDTES